MSFDVLSYITNFKKSKKDINNTEEFSNKYNKSRNKTKGSYLDYIISFLYILLITILLVYSVFTKNSTYLIIILILTILYIFYKIIKS